MDKTTMKLMFSCKRKDWGTPQDFFDKLNDEFNFTLDPCCTERTKKCNKYYTPEEDGLIQDWTNERVFVNPPYGREIKNWIKKCYEEKEKAELIVMLIPARTDTSYFHDYIYGKAELRFIRGRLKFYNPDSDLDKKKWTGAPFPSLLAIFKKSSGSLEK